MVSRPGAALAVLFGLSGASVAAAQDEVRPRAGVVLSGQIQFPRAQQMMIQTGPADGSRLRVYMGFDGRCRGGGLAEAWAATIATTPRVRVKDGRFSARLKGRARDLGGVEGRTGTFRWRFSGRFVEPDVVRATVTGAGEVRVGGKVVSRCTIAKPASVRLAMRSR
jgi:hypothetical protein